MSALHDADTDTDSDSPDTREDPREEITRVGREDVGVSGESESVSASWNAGFTTF